MDNTAITIKYNKPKILLVDLEKECSNYLQQKGYNVKYGSFGDLISVSKSHHYIQVTTNPNIPNFQEQEIIIVDLGITRNHIRRVIHNSDKQPKHLECIWAECSVPLIDARQIEMQLIKNDFDRIINHGGLAIIFSSEFITQNFLIGKMDWDGSIYEKRNIQHFNWSFLSQLYDVDVKNDCGNEIFAISQNTNFNQFLTKHFSNSKFNCSMEPSASIKENWFCLGKNKYNDTVSVFIKIDNGDYPCSGIFIFPQINDKKNFIYELIRDHIPSFFPHLFPDVENNTWIHREDYEIKEVNRLQSEISNVEEAAKNKIRAIKSRIKNVQEVKQYLYTILNGTDDQLVQAVIKIFLDLGFKDVVDVDKKLKEEGNAGSLREQGNRMKLSRDFRL